MTTENPQNQAFTEDAEKSRQLATTLNAITLEQLQLSEQVGAIKAFEFTRKVITVSTIKMLAEIKETKKYKELRVLDATGNSQHVSTWEDFCNSLGVSRQKVDLDIQNLSAFGEDFLETSQRMGVGYRDLRKLRKIPEDERALIINGEAVQAQDKDALVELIEDMSVKHATEKQKLKAEIKDQKKQVKSLQDEAQATQRVLADKNKLIDEKTTELELKLSAPAYDRACEYAQKIAVLSVEAVQLFGKVTALYEHISTDEELPEQLRVNQGNFLLEIKAQANAITDQYFLGDVSVDDDELDWMAAANAEIAQRNAGE